MYVSSANNTIIDLTTSDISFIYNNNNKGLRIVPWGTPDKTVTLSENVPCATKSCVGFCKKFDIDL